MKNIKKTISAIMAAAVIFGTAAMSVSADKLKVTDGVIYKYDDDSNLIGEYSGWAILDGVSRRYIDGVPYTGWLKNKDGTYKYVLDGFVVKGEMPIKNTVCTFDENGILTERKNADIIVTQYQYNNTFAGTDVITIDAKAVGKAVHEMYDIEKFERWEQGEWVDCLGGDVEYVTRDSLYILDSEELDIEIEFAPESYLGEKITAGYYRMTLPSSVGNVYTIIKITDKNLF